MALSGRRNMNTNSSRLECCTGKIVRSGGDFEDRKYALYLFRRVGDPTQSQILVRCVDLRAVHVDNEKQVRSAVEPESSIHSLVFVAGKCGVRVDHEGLNVVLDEKSE